MEEQQYIVSIFVILAVICFSLLWDKIEKIVKSLKKNDHLPNVTDVGQRVVFRERTFIVTEISYGKSYDREHLDLRLEEEDAFLGIRKITNKGHK